MKRILSIAGTDPTGGAGIQADLKSISALGGYGMAVVTALVAQNTHGVRDIHTPPTAFLRQQLDAVSDDVHIDAVKIGMLGDTATIAEVSDWLQTTRPPIVVLDPVMVATSGDRLLAADAENAVFDLLAHIDMVTPNLAELALLAGEPAAKTWADALDQGRRFMSRHGTGVLVKGGHLAGGECPDALLVPNAEPVKVKTERIDTANTHGTGCSMSAGLATLRSRTGDWQTAFEQTKSWLQDALAHADDLDVGTGHGPIHHFHWLYAASGMADTGLKASGSGAANRVATEPAGPHTAALWRSAVELRAEIDGLEFVRALGDGTLSQSAFEHYLTQDALYLQDYARALARASQLAPDRQAQAFWAKAAREAIVTEMALHTGFLAAADAAEARPVTRAYTNHLLAVAAQGSYAALAAAVLPCFWIYLDIGRRLHARRTPDHPFRDWLDTYADPAFAEATAEAIARTEEALATASERDRAAAADAFRHATRLERDFFAAGATP